MLELPEFKIMCFYYQRQLAAKLGLQPAWNSNGLILLLAKVWEGDKTSWVLKTDSATYKLFKSSKRPSRAINIIELYQFLTFARPIFNPLADKLDKDFRKRFQDWAMAGWLEQETVTLEGIFTWWWEAKYNGITVIEIAEQEIAMYRYYMQ